MKALRDMALCRRLSSALREIEISVVDHELQQFERLVTRAGFHEAALGKPDVQRALRHFILETFAEIDVLIDGMAGRPWGYRRVSSEPDYLVLRGLRFHEFPYSAEADVRGAFVVGLSSFLGDPSPCHHRWPDSHLAYRHIKGWTVAANESRMRRDGMTSGFPQTDSAFKLAPEPILALFVAQAARDGGDTLLWSGASVMEWIAAQPDGCEAVEIMASHDFAFVGSVARPNRVIFAPILLGNDRAKMRYKRDAIEDAARVLGRRLFREERLAMDMIDAAANSPDLTFRLKLDDGDAIIVDNHRTLHARTDFADPNRHLLKTAIVS
jgi:hypothetical protein